MMENASEKGIAVICDGQGIVQSVVRDELGLASRLSPGNSILDLVDPVDQEKGRQFLLALQNRQAVFDWEIVARWQEKLLPLHFAGGAVNGGFLVIVALSLNALTSLNEELTRINNEQTNSLRATAKELASRQRAQGGANLYDELTRINNELANLQRELFKKTVELEKLNELKNQFLGMAAHDMRSPLGIILTYSEFLEEEVAPKLNEEQKAFILILKNTSEFLLRMINDLLDVARIESGNLNLDLQPTDLTELLRHNVGLNRVLAQKKQIEMELVIDEALPTFRLDPGKIEQVLYNLLGNAVKFSHPHTKVVVHLGREKEAALITVTDQGQGIPAQELEKLFKPFGRTRIKSTGGEASTGLGLLIVRRIVEGHHGSVRVDSVVGKGSSFQVRLPLEARPMAGMRPGNPRAPAPSTSR